MAVAEIRHEVRSSERSKVTRRPAVGTGRHAPEQEGVAEVVARLTFVA